jgi:hypothetical protein
VGELKAWQGDFQQLHRDMFPQKCVSSQPFKINLHLKCTLANILLISFTFKFKFMFCREGTHILMETRGRNNNASTKHEFKFKCERY